MVGVVVPVVVELVVGVVVSVVVVSVVVGVDVAVDVTVVVNVVDGVVISQSAKVPSSNDTTIKLSNAAVEVQSVAILMIPPNVQENSTDSDSPRECSPSNCVNAAALPSQSLLF